MKFKTIIAFGLMAAIFGCAPYQQLKPKVDLSSSEGQLIELKKDDKFFKLSKDKQYYIAFPAPQENNFYLVLSVPSKSMFHSSLVDYYKGSTIGKQIPEDSLSNPQQCVYPIGKATPVYYWLIDKVTQELELSMQYRYVPQWRFRYENKSAEYKKVLADNRVDRSVYTTLGTSFHFDKNFNFGVAIDTVKRNSARLDNVHKALLAIESIFPQGINQQDKAYADFQNLRAQLEDEMKFQAAYTAVLEFGDKEIKSRGNMPLFMAFVNDFISYFGKKATIAPNAVTETQAMMSKHLEDVVPYYEKLMQGKQDETPPDTAQFAMTSFYLLPTLYGTAGIQQTAPFSALYSFVSDFDKAAKGLIAGRDSLNQVHSAVRGAPAMPQANFYTNIIARFTAIQKALPAPLGQTHGKYKSFPCTEKLNDEIQKLAAEAESRANQYRQAESVTSSVAGFLSQRDFRSALTLLKQNIGLDFLTDKFRKLDTLSVQDQDRKTRDAVANNRFPEAEGTLKQFNSDQTFLFPQNILGMRDRMVSDLEDSLYIVVDRVSRQRVDKFLEENVDTFENIDSLYTDSVFLPAYDITFSSGSKRELYQRKADSVTHLAKLKDNEFPSKAVNLLFDKFVKNPDDNGVLRGRAIVAHGKHYKGEDEKVKAKIRECDPNSPKWIVEPKEYRRLYVLPTTDNRRGGNNKYFFRINVKIPTEAQFPVYDVNIKLPKEIAANAAQTQWYEKMTMNNNLLKNEGRFSITAPTAQNDFECQITPVSMLKDKSNFLDVTFEHKSFKVLVVSVMVQKPIIKKN